MVNSMVPIRDYLASINMSRPQLSYCPSTMCRAMPSQRHQECVRSCRGNKQDFQTSTCYRMSGALHFATSSLGFAPQ